MPQEASKKDDRVPCTPLPEPSSPSSPSYTQDGSGTPLVLLQPRKGRIEAKDVEPWVGNLFRFLYIRYGVSSSKAITMMARHFLKTAQFEGKDDLKITISEEKNEIDTMLRAAPPKSYVLDLRTQEIDELATKLECYSMQGSIAVKKEIGPKGLMHLHDELRNKLYDRTLPMEQRVRIYELLKKIETILDTVKFDEDYAKHEFERQSFRNRVIEHGGALHAKKRPK